MSNVKAPAYRLSHFHHRIFSTATLVCMAGLYTIERVWRWEDAFFLIACGYLLEAIFEMLRPELQPPNILA